MIKVPAAREFSALEKNYLFTEVRRKTQKFLTENGGEVINLGIGDVAFPLPPVVVEAMVKATLEMGDNARFKGYPPEGGYPFLKEAIAGRYLKRGVKIDADEIFIGDGAKSDTSSFPDIFGRADVLITDPVYPVYADSSVLRGNRVTFVRGNKQNRFLPSPRGVEKKPYLIFLCSPNNPSGAAYGHDGLKEWVDFALETGSALLFDAAYSAFAGVGVPSSVFEIDGARECCAEFGSFSKSAGFTGLRCSWTVVPKELKCRKSQVSALWKRRQSVKFNGVSYVIQRAAEAALSERGITECGHAVEIYKKNAAAFTAFFKARGIWHTGGELSPYVWIECPKNLSSVEFFNGLLSGCRVVGTPGSGFGKAGEGFFRFSGFATENAAAEAVRRFERSDLFR